MLVSTDKPHPEFSKNKILNKLRQNSFTLLPCSSLTLGASFPLSTSAGWGWGGVSVPPAFWPCKCIFPNLNYLVTGFNFFFFFFRYQNFWYMSDFQELSYIKQTKLMNSVQSFNIYILHNWPVRLTWTNAAHLALFTAIISFVCSHPEPSHSIPKHHQVQK